MTTRSGQPSTWRRLTDLGTDAEVRALGLPASCLTTEDAVLVEGADPVELAMRMHRLAEDAGRQQLTAAGPWVDADEAETWRRSRRAGRLHIVQPAHVVVRWVDGEPPRASTRRAARRRPVVSLTLDPSTTAWLTSEAARLGVSVSVVVDRMVDRARGAI